MMGVLSCQVRGGETRLRKRLRINSFAKRLQKRGFEKLGFLDRKVEADLLVYDAIELLSLAHN